MTSPQNPWPQGPNQQFAPQQQPLPQPPQQFGPPQHAGQPQQFGYPQQHVAVPGKPPGSVALASWLGAVWAPISALIGLVGFVITTMTILDYGLAVLPILINGVLMLGAVVCAVLWVVFGGGLRRGRNSARITLVVLAGLWLAHTLYAAVTFVLSLGGDFGIIASNPILFLHIADLLVSLVVPIVFLVLVFGKQANAYFKAMSVR
ncbi:hypothetical protein SAMN02982929_05125 [Saccharopolyspora kobensis]|uniref:Uncharacterized protein n=1 Tax=Saccharopolyspora kobensis TaxID=146035 RepID=A0A1H6DXB5_9PSEU|nr:hypothetical protein [Saccharopolyspora kobensis]SEG89990.1 hypothetical protein SAMN02982929_05125 [Saccharopolyspora kobensis]SFD88456.1 hypothetical protein SAMN05216506_10798 [Saccharopolyspora kobensis]